MRSRPSTTRPASRPVLLALALAGCGTLTLSCPTLAAAATTHGAHGGNLPGVLPLASIFSDILGPVLGFGKDLIKTIFGGLLSLMFGGSWKILLHPYRVLEWLIGLPGTGASTALVPFTAGVGGPFTSLVADTQSIGLGLLPLALGTNVLHMISGGVFSRPRDHVGDMGKVLVAACAILAWPWLFGQAIDLANTITLAMLHAANAGGNLWKTLATYFAIAFAGGFLDIITTLFLIATALLLVALIVMKIVLMIAVAFLLVIGPIAIAFWPFEALSGILTLFGSVFVGLALIPLGWATLFALFAAFGASLTSFSSFLHAGLIGGATSKIFDLVCSLICFYLAWKWPFLILGRITSLVGGRAAEAGAAFGAIAKGHLSSSAALARRQPIPATGGGDGIASGGQVGRTATGGESAGDGGGRLSRLANMYAAGAGVAGGAVGASIGRLSPMYGAGRAHRKLTAPAHTLGQTGSDANSHLPGASHPGGMASRVGALASDAFTARIGALSGTAPAGPLGAAIGGGADAGFAAVRESGADFTATPQPGGAASHQDLARQAANTAALAHPTIPGGHPQGGGTPRTNGAAPVGDAVPSAGPSGPGATRGGTPPAPGSPAARSGSGGDPRQSLQTPVQTPPAAALSVREPSTQPPARPSSTSPPPPTPPPPPVGSPAAGPTSLNPAGHATPPSATPSRPASPPAAAPRSRPAAGNPPTPSRPAAAPASAPVADSNVRDTAAANRQPPTPPQP